ncbi:hypothetical protein Y1Q_0007245 [Alligator mississippiensis]|uniref:MORC family CW-type zinc finger protein 4 n=2 Tax=Alligator mississippiensis TaxID=8496 RepID=A0A151NMX2_ALLMI|nr:hypothetical protein Y1Q_0007245 [Alligator mississippiensis]
MLQTGGKHKLSVEEELLEKRRRYQEQVESFPPDLTSTSPPISSLQKVSTKAKQDDCYKSNIKEDVSVTENMCPCLSRDQQDVSSGTSHPGNLCSKDKSPAPDSPVAGVEEEMAVVQGDLEEQMPNLVAESQVAGGSVCVNMYGSMEEMGKRPFVAVVGISKTAAESGAPIQLIPLGREERLDRPKVEEKVLSSNDPPLEGDRDRGDLQELTTVDQKDTVKQQELRRAAENVSVVLKSVLAERDLLQCKVEKLEQEKCNLRADLLKSQQELASLRAQDTEGLYWSKKHMGYRQAELQELKAKLERTTEEKTELKERLRETEMHLEVLKEAHVSCRSPERGDSKRSEITMEKLKNLRLKVTRLLSLVLPHLELQDINFESDQVDEILQTVLETNHMSE